MQVPMRILKLLSLVLLLSSAALATQSIVAHTTNTCSSGGGSSCGITVTSSTAGDTIILMGRLGSITTATCSDNKSDSYTVSTITGQSAIAVCYAYNVAAGVTTATMAGGSGFDTYYILEVELGGTAISSGLDISTTAWNGTTGSPFATNSFVTTASDLVIAFGTLPTSGVTCVAAGSYTILDTANDTTHGGFYCDEYLLNSSTGLQTASFTTGSTTTINYASAFAFLPAGPVASGVQIGGSVKIGGNVLIGP
jgi:hypothetical protein